MTPSDLRRKASDGGASDAITLQLGYRPPFAWDELMSFLAARSIQGVESILDGRYRRSVAVQAGGISHRGWIEVFRHPKGPSIVVRMDGALVRVIPQVLVRVKRLFDLAAHPREIESVLGAVAQNRPGLRVPGAFDGFETAVRAILGQQITVKAASTIAGRLAVALGDCIHTPFIEIHCLFPEPQKFVETDISRLVELGITAQRARSLAALARAVTDGSVCLDPCGDVEETLKALMNLPGVGTWTAQYVAMRALAWPDAFPHTDYGVMKALKETSPARVLAVAEKWRPWRAYAAMHLWASLKGKQDG